MKLDACIKKITKYLASEIAQPLLVNVQNGDDLDRIVTYFNRKEKMFSCRVDFIFKILRRRRNKKIFSKHHQYDYFRSRCSYDISM